MADETQPEPGAGLADAPRLADARRRLVTPLAWLVPAAFVLSLISLFLPWFEPGATSARRSIDLATLRAWDDGTIFVVTPVALLLAATVTVSLLLGRPFGRFRGQSEPARPAGWFVVAAGVLSAVCIGIEWLLVPSQFPNWHVAEATFRLGGLTLGRNPQLGYLLNAAAAVAAVAGGAVMVILSRADTVER